MFYVLSSNSFLPQNLYTYILILICGQFYSALSDFNITFQNISGGKISIHKTGRDVGRWWSAAGLGALSVVVYAWDILKEVTIIFITSTIVWPPANNKQGTQPCPSTENWIKDLLNMVPPIRTSPLSQSLPSGSFHKPLNLLHQKADRLKTTITGHYQSDHMDHSLV